MPDHATIARFICRHEQALAGLFGEVLKLCDRARLAQAGVVSIDGTRIAGNASPEVNHAFEQIATEILAEAKREREREYEDAELIEPEGEPAEEVALELDAKNIIGRGRQGRDAWLREGKRQIEQHRWEHPDPIPRERSRRGLLAAQRLETDHDVECRSNAAYEHYRATARDRLGRRLGRPPSPYAPPQLPAGKVNVTDPDPRPIPIGFGFVQGYNAQAAVNEQQIVLAAKITNISTDFSQLAPIVSATLGELEHAGIDQLPQAVSADAGYWSGEASDRLGGPREPPTCLAQPESELL